MHVGRNVLYRISRRISMRYLLLGVAALCLLWMPLQPLAAADMSDSHAFKFTGRLHVLLLHLPIGILLLGILGGVLRLFRLSVFDDKSLLIILLCGSLSALAAVSTGLILAQEDGDLSSAVQWHMYAGLSLYAISLLNVFSFRRFVLRPQQSQRLLCFGSFVVCAWLVAWTGHLGGNLSHPHFIDKYAPWTSQAQQDSAPSSVASSVASSASGQTLEPAASLPNNVDQHTATVIKQGVTEQTNISSVTKNTSDNASKTHLQDRAKSDATSKAKAATRIASKSETQAGMDGRGVAPQQALNLAANSALYQQQVRAIFKARCYECHGENKHKGGLRLDSPMEIRKGGKNGEIFTPGQPLKSSLYQLCALDPLDPDIMPAKGDPLNENELKIISQWIAGGAHFSAAEARTEADAHTPTLTATEAEAKAALKVAPKADVKAEAKQANPSQGDSARKPVDQSTHNTELEQRSRNLAAPDPAALRALVNNGVLINRLSSNGAMLELDMRYFTGSFAQLTPILSKVAQQVAWIDAGRAHLNDKDLAHLMQCSQLLRLDLHQTQISDAGLQLIAQQQELQILNVYGCQVSDNGLKHLSSLKQLQKIYLWQTKVTQAGVSALQRALPKLEVNLGTD